MSTFKTSIISLLCPWRPEKNPMFSSHLQLIAKHSTIKTKILNPPFSFVVVLSVFPSPPLSLSEAYREPGHTIVNLLIAKLFPLELEHHLIHLDVQRIGFFK